MPSTDLPLQGKKLGLVSSFLSGVGLTLAFPPLNLSFLAYLVFIPLIIFSKERPFLSGLVFGLGHLTTLLYWIMFVIVPPPTKRWLIFGVVVLIIYLSLYYGVLGVGLKHLGPISLPFLIVVLEFIRSQGEIGFPWGLIGYTQVQYLPVLQLSSLFGIYGLSFFVGSVNLLVYYMIRKRDYYLITIPIVVVISGLLMLGRSDHTDLKLGILQPNIDTNIVWGRNQREETMRMLIAETESLAQDGVDLIIWPESMLPFMIFHHKDYLRLIESVADSHSVAIFIGTGIMERKDGYHLYNGAVLIKSDSGISGIYRKVHLVPFSEHIPYEEKFRFLQKVRFGQSNYHPGDTLPIFDVGKRFGGLICFESIFPELSRSYLENGADFLINITNDGWFGRSPGPYQHAQMAVVRAVEFRIPLVRCANNGISMVVDPYGRVVKKTALFEKTKILAFLPEGMGDSLYSKIGDIIVLISAIFLIILTGRPFLLRYRRR